MVLTGFKIAVRLKYGQFCKNGRMDGKKERADLRIAYNNQKLNIRNSKV